MKKIISLGLALGCIGVSAAANNYDLLGRKGSQMNSPMVYKNVDYLKQKKNVSRNFALMKTGTGLRNNVYALEGRYFSQGWGGSYYYTSKQYYSNYSDPQNWPYLTARYGYLNPSNSSFIQTRMSNASSVPVDNYETHVSGYSASFLNMSFSNPVQASPYENGQQITYKRLNTVRDEESYSNRFSFTDWYSDFPSQEMSDVGVYLKVNARPSMMKKNDDIRYFVDASSGSFKDMPGHEMDATRLYKILKNTSQRSVVYVSTNEPENPSDNSRATQIYLGVRGIKNSMGTESAQLKYSSSGKALDNYIYDNRTIEIVPAGNSKNSNKYFANEAHAANAITVGAIDPTTGRKAGYNPTSIPRYCRPDYKPCNNGNGTYMGTNKPEIYNYSHVYLSEKNKRYVKSNSTTTYSYPSYYDGTEIAAAYTAGLVSDLLATNAFYRWHPEVVRALLLTSSAASGKNVPTYEMVMPERGSKNVVHDSRYWVGDFNKLKTSNKEIAFAIKMSDFENYKNKRFVAAISWLSRGDEIERVGKIPQNFDLIVAPSDNANVNDALYNPSYSVSVDNNYELVPFRAYRDYMVFKIQLKEDLSSSDYKNQIALGFDLIAY